MTRPMRTHSTVHDAINGSFLRHESTVMEPLQLLSLDGGGLYGLTQACWLKQLAERDERFLVRPTWDSDTGKRELDALCKDFHKHHGRDASDRDIELYKEFNNPTDPHHPSMLMFAGCSAGGVNALLMAQFENPREAIIPRDEYNGDSMLVTFWKESGLYTNEKDKADKFWSYLMVTPWLGTRDCLDLLAQDQYFGNRKMRDLRHPVLVSIYNWYDRSRTPEFPPIEALKAPETPPSNNPLADLFSKRFKNPYKRDLVPSFMQWKAANQFMRDRPINSLDRTWGPDWLRFFGPSLRHDWINGILGAEVKRGWSKEEVDFVLHAKEVLRWFSKQEIVRDDDDVNLVDAGFASMSMPPARGVRGGAGDGAVCNPNPSIDLLVAALRIRSVRTYAYVKFQHVAEALGRTERKRDEYKKKLGDLHKGMKLQVTFEERVERMAQRLAEQPLGVRMLSLGAGETQPAYAIRDFEFGPLPFMTVPVGYAWGKQTPNSFTYNQAMQDVDSNLSTLLATDPEPDAPFSSAYFRINPDINLIPPGPVLKFVRNDFLRAKLIDMVVEASKSPDSTERINAASEWLKTTGHWNPSAKEGRPEFRWDSLHSQTLGTLLGDLLGHKNTQHLIDLLHYMGTNTEKVFQKAVNNLGNLDEGELQGILDLLSRGLEHDETKMTEKSPS